MTDHINLRPVAYMLVAVAFLMAFILYPSLPDPMPTHWNSAGEVNGYMSKTYGLFIFPIIMLVLVILFRILPKLDPLKKNYHMFKPHYDHFILIITGFMFYVYLLTILFSLGFKFNMTLFMMPGLAVMFFYIGILLEHSKQNWFIGIRTPWTLSSEIVWKKTHWLAAKLFKIAGVIALFSVFFGTWGIWIGVLPLIFAALIPVVYSCVIYQDEKKHSTKTENTKKKTEHTKKKTAKNKKTKKK